MKRLLFMLIMFCVANAQTLKVATGTFTGNGTSQSITGLGFTPKFVMIKGNTAQNGLWRCAAHTTNLSSQTTNADDVTDGITSLDADGFSVGSNARGNSNSVIYYYVALTGDNVATGIGTGTGSGVTVNIGQSFTPDIIIAKSGGGTKYPYLWTSAHVDPASSPLTTSDQNTLGMHAVTSAQFEIGSNISVSGQSYWWIAIDADANALEVGSFTGDGNDNRNISLSVSWEPTFALVKNSAFAATGIWRTADVSGDNGLRFDNAGFLANTIQSVGSGTLQVGSNSAVNGNGNKVYYVALRNYVVSTIKNSNKYGGYNGFNKY